MDFDETYENKKIRRNKEFVYDQWRKYLCIGVVKEDVSRNECPNMDLNSEQVRTVFDYGYKFAMHKNLEMIEELFKRKFDKEKSEEIEKILASIKDRIETSRCVESCLVSYDRKMLSDSINRDAKFEDSIRNTSLSSWASKSM